MELSFEYSDENIEASIEEFDGKSFIHCKVLRNTPRMIRFARELLDRAIALRLEAGDYRPIYSCVNPRFAKMMGGTHHLDIPHEGRIIEVWIWQTQ